MVDYDDAAPPDPKRPRVSKYGRTVKVKKFDNDDMWTTDIFESSPTSPSSGFRSKPL